MKKIAMVLPSLGGGGAERITLNLAARLVELGHEVHIILQANRIAHEVDEHLQIHALSAKGKLTGIRGLDQVLLARRLKKLLTLLSPARPFDLILSNLLSADCIVSRLSLDNIYHVIHNTTSLEARSQPSQRRARRKLALVKCTYKDRDLVCVSNGVRDDLVEVVGVQPRSIRTIYNPFDIEAIRRKAAQRVEGLPEQPYIIHVGRIHRQKRVDVLLQAFKDVRGDCKLVMLAKPTQALREMIAANGLEDRVLLPGFQTNPYPWIKNARLFVLSSDYEGLPTVIIEALICGTPVVSTDCPSGPAEILTGPLREWLVPPREPQALAAAVNRALDRQEQGNIDLDNCGLEKFGIDAVVEQYLALADS